MRRELTPAEKQLWQKLRNQQVLGFKFRRQHAIDRFIVDFYCGEVQLVVEVDGEIHDYTPEKDAIRQEFLQSLGLRVVRFKNEDVLQSIEEVLAEIVRWLQEEPHPQPPPRKRGGG
ncbi:endonuclease domain-containing protein [Nodularia sp. LEGE 06071]|uniref:endonuclease domain-containing protein n=1 Tax=Nodularia sp. LEGE 06071 TaxID=2777965 RepID=UPI00187FE5CA|nr:endonuclease domain-containing protein [Nodularia sp. LEGE 04288]MBE9198585.1 endonuclease domain-containing protein [Nodularia sp. LEGE 06071]MCC2693563.1 endonuclease domain-containing protein [Nodularia sp. LEGE 04288]